MEFKLQNEICQHILLNRINSSFEWKLTEMSHWEKNSGDKICLEWRKTESIFVNEGHWL
jgi:hypothetical protein